MFRHAIKKAFFDLWDHLFFALALNLVFTLGVLGLVVLWFALSAVGPSAFFLATPVPFLVASFLGGLAAFWARDVVVTGSARFGDFAPHWAASWKPSLAFGVAWLVLAAGAVFGVPFYGSLNPIAGFAFGVVMAWVIFFAAGMSLFYPGLNAQVEPQVRKLARKSFLLFLANPWASFVMVLGVLVIGALSIVTLGFFPGVFGLAIWLQVCFRFLLAKYDWIEANPEADAKKVPWAEVLAEDMEKVGPRTLKNLIFPWKD